MQGIGYSKEVRDATVRPLYFTQAEDDEQTMVAEKIVDLVFHVAKQKELERPGELFQTSAIHSDGLDFFANPPQDKDEIIGMARPDIVIHNGIPKVIEVNVGSTLGGTVECYELLHFFANNFIGRQVSKKVPYPAENPMTLIAGYLREIGIRRGCGELPRVGLLEWDYWQEGNYRFAVYLLHPGALRIYESRRY